MIGFLKRQGIAFYTSILAALLALIAMIFTCVSSSIVGYSIPGIAWVVVCSILVLLLIASSIFFSNRSEREIIPTICLILSVVLCISCFGIIISARAYLVGTLWITNLDSTNPLAVSALNTATVGFVMYLISAVLFVVSAFFSFRKKTHEESDTQEVA